MSDVTVVEHSFGVGNDMFSTKVSEKVNVVEQGPLMLYIERYAEPRQYEGRPEATWFEGGFLRARYSDGTVESWNVDDIKSWTTQPVES